MHGGREHTRALFAHQAHRVPPCKRARRANACALYPLHPRTRDARNGDGHSTGGIPPHALADECLYQHFRIRTGRMDGKADGSDRLSPIAFRLQAAAAAPVPPLQAD